MPLQSDLILKSLGKCHSLQFIDAGWTGRGSAELLCQKSEIRFEALTPVTQRFTVSKIGS